MPQTHKVDIQPVAGQMAFDPASITITTGDTVEWTNRMSVPHTVTADDGGFDSGNIQENQTFSHAFCASGTVNYHCKIHRFMRGSIAVT
jgi:plastocyanin